MLKKLKKLAKAASDVWDKTKSLLKSFIDTAKVEASKMALKVMNKAEDAYGSLMNLPAAWRTLAIATGVVVVILAPVASIGLATLTVLPFVDSPVMMLVTEVAAFSIFSVLFTIAAELVALFIACSVVEFIVYWKERYDEYKDIEPAQSCVQGNC